MKKILIITFFLLLCMFSLSGNSKIFLKKYGLISEEKKDYIRITIPNSTNRMYSASYILSTYARSHPPIANGT